MQREQESYTDTNSDNQNLVHLLQDLVQIPSWIPDDPEKRLTQNENGVVDYLESWLKKNTSMDVERQSLEGGRFNLIAAKGQPDLIFLGHTDTVQPSVDAPYDQLKAEIHDGKIWGRGTTDMKSGIASMIQALQMSKNYNNVWAFFYADEEYNFLGMKALVEQYKDLRPKILISSDGADLHIGHGCRGLIEFRGRVIGETGHPAHGTGRNAITEGFKGIGELQKYLSGYEHPVMGKTSFNLAHILGGARLPDSLLSSGRLGKVGQAGNVVPDIMEFVVDIRPSSPDLTLPKTIGIVQDYFKENGIEFQVVEQTHNLGAWYTDVSDLKAYTEIAKESLKQENISYENPGKSGYIDLQMLWNVVGRPPAFMFGGGKGNTAHKPDEHIEIKDLIKTRDFFYNVLEKHH